MISELLYQIKQIKQLKFSDSVILLYQIPWGGRSESPVALSGPAYVLGRLHDSHVKANCNETLQEYFDSYPHEANKNYDF